MTWPRQAELEASGGSSERHVYSKPWGGSLFGIRVFAGVIKDLEMRLVWMRVDPKSNDKCPYKRLRRRRHTHTHTEATWGQRQ